MSLTPVRNLQLHNQIERVLHVPGNYQGGILEMAIVIDCRYDKEAVRELCADVIASCKRQSEVFRNVRLNMVTWSGEGIRTHTVASAHVQMGSFFENYAAEDAGAARRAVEIMEYLKKFHARSKLILLLLPEEESFSHVQEEPERLRQAMSPFLKQKLVIIYPDRMESGTEFFIKIL